MSDPIIIAIVSAFTGAAIAALTTWNFKLDERIYKIAGLISMITEQLTSVGKDLRELNSRLHEHETYFWTGEERRRSEMKGDKNG